MSDDVAVVFLHDGNGTRLGQLTTADEVNRSYALNEAGIAHLEIAVDDPLIGETKPQRGLILVIESALYPRPWVGKVVGRAGVPDEGHVQLQAKDMTTILTERFTPTDYTTSLSAGPEMTRVLAEINRVNPTGIQPGDISNHGELAAGLAFPEWSGRRAFDAIADSAGIEWWLDHEVFPQAISSKLRIAPHRGDNRFRLVQLVEGEHCTIQRWLEEGEAAAFASSIIAAAESIEQAFVDRIRVTTIVEEGAGFGQQFTPPVPTSNSVVTTGPGGRKTKTSGISIAPHGFVREAESLGNNPITRRQIVEVREELKTREITIQAAQFLLRRRALAERVVEVSVVDVDLWCEVEPGDVIALQSYSAFANEGFEGPARVLGTNPREDEGEMPVVLELLAMPDDEAEV